MENPSNSSPSNSPEFEFWMVRNPSSQQPTLHSADQLFSDGILLPLHLLTTDDPPDPPTNPPDNNIITNNSIINNNSNNNTHGHGSDLKTTSISSKRWKDIFKKTPQNKEVDKKKKKKERSSVSGSGVGTELNINLWPFSRSRSAGNSRPRTVVVGNRKVSSAPCSRSNSTGDKNRKWPVSPGRPGVHLGRTSPVWQAKRFGQSRSLHDNLVRNTAEKAPRPTKSASTGAGGNGKVLSVNVPTCIGYRQRMGCQSDVSKENYDGDVTPVGGGGGEGGATGLFNLRSLFTKKVF